MQVKNRTHRHGPTPLSAFLPDFRRAGALVPAQYGRGFFLRHHSSVSSTARSSSDSACRVLASCVNTRRRNALRAAAAAVWGSGFGFVMLLIFRPAQPVSQPVNAPILSIGGAL